jgi:hypothetical protein
MGRGSPDGQEAWKVHSRCCRGNQGRVANREWEKTGAKNPKKSDSCELRKQMAVEDLI